ncbi:hypothetical protein MsAc7_06920 [Methanolapillus millepedarum]|uniref:Uncharacterized protein n=1 Tax=Methanolapillus millepedarum TaxID=3028296 RepID=A0AA96V3E3_9EURY|nr:hypothetical protein MsAc7_06920 [Methanosarcinaceae archaeon Ac7]
MSRKRQTSSNPITDFLIARNVPEKQAKIIFWTIILFSLYLFIGLFLGDFV